MIYKKIGISIGALALAACSSLPDGGSSDAKLYSERCGACHKPPRPFDQHAYQWERLITMIDRRVLHPEIKPLTQDERDTILRYLTAHARPDKKDQTSPPTKGKPVEELKLPNQ